MKFAIIFVIIVYLVLATANWRNEKRKAETAREWVKQNYSCK